MFAEGGGGGRRRPAPATSLHGRPGQNWPRKRATAGAAHECETSAGGTGWGRGGPARRRPAICIPGASATVARQVDPTIARTSPSEDINPGSKSSLSSDTGRFASLTCASPHPTAHRLLRPPSAQLKTLKRRRHSLDYRLGTAGIRTWLRSRVSEQHFSSIAAVSMAVSGACPNGSCRTWHSTDWIRDPGK
jgi:hypothetical protein